LSRFLITFKALILERRTFVKKAVLSSFSAFIVTELVFGYKLPNGYKPLALQEPDPFKMFRKNKDMVILNDKP
jgi:sulfite oxidase